MVLGLALAGCAGGPRLAEQGVGIETCIEAYRAMDRTVMRAGAADAEAVRIAGFPHLRANRFLASFAGRDLTADEFAAWIDRMVDLDRTGRTVELANLPADRRAGLDGRIRGLDRSWPDAASAVDTCAGRLASATRRLGPQDPGLRAAVVVPDDYSVLARTLGLYPLTAVPVALGYQRWQARNLPAFARPLDQAPVGQPVLYRPRAGEGGVSAADVRRLLARAAARDPLAIPDLDEDELRALAAAFAPVLLVEARSEADRIGHPVWRTDGLPDVDPARPVGFVRLEHAWFENRPIAQLVYLFWFDARPPDGPIDLLAGRLDGLIWRVSLGADGRPVVYDTIHACGCYHLFFPAPGTVALDLPENSPGDPRDPVLVPARAEVSAPEERVLVRVAPGSHYVTGIRALERVDRPSGQAVEYELMVGAIPDGPLRSMPAPDGGQRSLYGPDGIIDGTERGERVLLWPMGILEPGAMRQWGRHAVAFVGERHFDDPHLIERAFAR